MEIIACTDPAIRGKMDAWSTERKLSAYEKEQLELAAIALSVHEKNAVDFAAIYKEAARRILARRQRGLRDRSSDNS